jgi:hypothetical protein
MNTFDFDIVYKKGSEMPADYLSRNLVAAISWATTDLQNAQSKLSKISYSTKNCLLTQNANSSLNFLRMIVSLKMTLFGVELNVNLNQAQSSFFSLLHLNNKPL